MKRKVFSLFCSNFLKGASNFRGKRSVKETTQKFHCLVQNFYCNVFKRKVLKSCTSYSFHHTSVVHYVLLQLLLLSSQAIYSTPPHSFSAFLFPLFWYLHLWLISLTKTEWGPGNFHGTNHSTEGNWKGTKIQHGENI